MKHTSRKRLGLSGTDLALAVFLSLFFHLALVAAAFLLYFAEPPKPLVPLFYEVKLVGQPAEVAPALSEVKPAPSGGTAPPPPKEEPKPKVKKKMPKARKAAPKAAKTAAKKGAIPATGK